jgi:D-amino-acid dehydrogenase
MMPNMLPRVGPGSKAGIYYNTGHGHLGWTLSAATAELIAARIEADLPFDGVGGQHVAAPKRMAAV